MAFIDGFLGLLSAAGTGTATEVVTTGYQRQPISFSTPRSGRSVSSMPFGFGFLGRTGTIFGRAVFDAPTGGRLLLVLPVATPRPFPLGGPTDAAEAGHIHLQFDALAQFPAGDAFTGGLAAGTMVGTVFDETDVVSRNAVVDPTTGSYRLIANAASLSTGVALTITRGVLAAT